MNLISIFTHGLCFDFSHQDVSAHDLYSFSNPSETCNISLQNQFLLILGVLWSKGMKLLEMKEMDVQLGKTG